MTDPRHRWSFSLRTLFVVVTLVAAIAATIRAFPELALLLAFVVVVFIVWVGAVVLGAVLLQAFVSAVARGVCRVIGIKDSPATPPETVRVLRAPPLA